MIQRIILIAVVIAGIAHAGTIDPQQEQFLEKYAKQDNAPNPEDMLINNDPEPSLKKGFKALYNGKNLDGWTPYGGHSEFEAKDDIIVGTCIKGSASTYLCTDNEDFKDFIFTCEMKWLSDGNSGVMFRSQTKKEMKKDKK